MASEVGSGQVAIFPTFKGFRKAVTSETDAAGKAGSTGFRKAFSKTGDESGKAVGTGFKKAFSKAAEGTSDKELKSLQDNVAKATRTLSAARLKQQDLAGKVRIAEAKLAEAQQKHAVGSSQVVAATERLRSATRQLNQANEVTANSTADLRDAQTRMAEAAARSGGKMETAGSRWGKRFRSGFTAVFGGAFLGNLASNLISGLGNAVRQGVGELKDFIMESIDISSDLNESINAVQVAFGDAAAGILKLGETSATSFGLSSRNLNAYAVQLSSFSQKIAGKGGDVAGAFESILGRATDFASVMNLEVADALALFQSGLAGETEPLRKYGLDLSGATVEAYAFANGIAKKGKALTEDQKIQARYGSLLEQTAKVAGDFANTSGELANKQRILAASWDEVQAKIGTAFLPVAEELVTILADDLLPVIADLAEKHGPDLADAFKEALPAFADMAEEVLPKLPELFDSLADAVPGVLELLEQATPVVIAVTENSAALFTVLGGLFNLLSGDVSLDDFLTKMTEIPGPIGDVIRASADLGTGIRNGFTDALREANNFRNSVKLKVDEVVEFFRSMPTRIRAFFEGAGEWLVDSGKALIRGFITGIRQMFKPVGDAMTSIIEWAKDFFPHSPAKRGPLSGSGWTEIGTSGSALIEQFQKGITRASVEAPLSAALSATTSVTAAGVSGGGMSVYVQNPFTGEYLLARMVSTADQRIQSTDAANERAVSRGRW